MDIDLIKRLSNSFGPPGTEEEPREILQTELEQFADNVEIDKLGNIFFYLNDKEDAPIVMIAAHLDEIALLITYIEDKGFLRFHTLGGIPASQLLGQRFVFKGNKGVLKGIIGTKPPHVMTEEERKKPARMDDLFVDIGAESKEVAEAKGCHIGMLGVYDSSFSELGNGYIRGKAFDDRIGCAVMAEAFKSLKGSKCNVVVVGTVQEEVGLRGAKTAAWQVEPDYGLALEGTFALDVPGSMPHKKSASLGKGPVITIADRSVIAHPKVLGALIESAEASGIPYQFKKIPSGGTDAGSIHLIKGGVPSGVLATPCRYVHGPAAIAHIEDYDNTVKLVDTFVRHISKT